MSIINIGKALLIVCIVIAAWVICDRLTSGLSVEVRTTVGFTAGILVTLFLLVPIIEDQA